MLFEDKFDTLDPKKWTFETMRDGLHRAGNEGVNRNGGHAHSASGKRWSAWYDEHHEKTARVTERGLELRGYAVNESDPTRTNYVRNGTPQPYGDCRLYTSWLQTWNRAWDNTTKSLRTDPKSPNLVFSPGCVTKVVMDFSQMCVPGHRVSVWLMPAYANADKSYNDNPADGIEIDLFEYDPAQPYHILCKCVGGAAGDTPNGYIDMRDHGVDLMKGDHEIALYWQPDSLVWTINDAKVQEDRKRVPQVESYLVISREMNSGIKPYSPAYAPPLVPADPGLYARSVIEGRDKLQDDLAVVRSLTVEAIEAAELPKETPPAESASSSKGTVREFLTWLGDMFEARK